MMPLLSPPMQTMLPPLEQPQNRKQLLGAFRYIDNKAFYILMKFDAKEKKNMSSWNFLGSDTTV